jgi:hypothetical protein
VSQAAAPAPGAAEAAAPPVDPFTDADALEELEHEITTLAAHIHAATHRLLTLIADFDRRRGWELGGHRSCAHWLAFRTGIDLGTSREKVRTARALTTLPQTSASMARGELSFSKVRALTRVATASNEGELLAYAQGTTTAQLERLVRGFRRGSRTDEVAWERECHESRTVSVFPDEDGMVVVRGRLPAEMGALLMRAIEAASDALYREEQPGQPQPGRVEPPTQRHEVESLKAAAQRRADALVLLAERALAAGFKAEEATSNARAERYQVVLHVEPETLEPEGEGGRSELDDGTRVAPARCSAVSPVSTEARQAHQVPGGSAHLKRPDVFPATAGWCGSRRMPTVRCWMWDAGRGRFRLR